MNNSFKLLFIFLTPLSIYAHTLLLNVIDNEDDTMTLVGEFSTGESAAGALVKLEALKSKKILFQKRLGDDSEMTVKIPNIPYQIILDGGPGHKVIKDGIAPINGFKEEKIEKNNLNKQSPNVKVESSTQTFKLLFFTAFILLLSTIVISIFNTKKLMKQLKSKH